LFCRISSDFKYKNVLEVHNDHSKPNLTISWNYPLKTPNYDMGLRGLVVQNMIGEESLFEDTHPNEVKSVLLMRIHEPYEVISKSSSNFFTMENQTTAYWITPHLLTYDSSIESLDYKK
jgi:hypothetical protein